MDHLLQPDRPPSSTISHQSHYPPPFPSLPDTPTGLLLTPARAPAQLPPPAHTRAMLAPQPQPSPNWNQPYHAPDHLSTTPTMATGSHLGLLACPAQSLLPDMSISPAGFQLPTPRPMHIQVSPITPSLYSGITAGFSPSIPQQGSYPIQSLLPELSISPAGFQLSTPCPMHVQAPPITPSHYPTITAGLTPCVPQQGWQSAGVNEYGLAGHGPRYYANNSVRRGPPHMYAATVIPPPPTSHVHPGYIPEVDFRSDNIGPSMLSTQTSIMDTSVQSGYSMDSLCMRW